MLVGGGGAYVGGDVLVARLLLSLDGSSGGRRECAMAREVKRADELVLLSCGSIGGRRLMLMRMLKQMLMLMLAARGVVAWCAKVRVLMLMLLMLMLILLLMLMLMLVLMLMRMVILLAVSGLVLMVLLVGWMVLLWAENVC